ncbi:MAG: glycosyltransferase [Gemmatimonadota bacterium]
MHSHPVVSVVVPSYNKGPFIQETIDSALCQRGVEVEVVVVDDASTDGTPQALEHYGERIRLRLLEGNSGAARARNIGAAMAEGTHLMFLDADDVLADEDSLSSLVEALQGRTDRFAACPWQRLRLEGERWTVYSPEKPLDPPGGDPVSAWLGKWYIPPCAILWPRELFKRSGGWDEELPVAQDEELMIRMFLRRTSIAHASQGEALYRFFEDGGTVSTTHDPERAAGRHLAVKKIEAEMVAQGLLPQYQHALGKKYFSLARTYLNPYPELSLRALADADRLIDHDRVMGSPLHRWLARIIGLERKERITRWLAGRGWVRRRSSGLPA